MSLALKIDAIKDQLNDPEFSCDILKITLQDGQEVNLDSLSELDTYIDHLFTVEYSDGRTEKYVLLDKYEGNYYFENINLYYDITVTPASSIN